MTFDMNITCTNCGKESVVTLEYDLDSMSAKIAEDITGVKPHYWMGEVDCPCGYETIAMMTVTCTKKGGGK